MHGLTFDPGQRRVLLLVQHNVTLYLMPALGIILSSGAQLHVILLGVMAPTVFFLLL